ncbi:MAG TPA: FAD-binding oxidoreductase [Rhizomicrobium sp.]|jgi:D-arginine dehydrogenase
MSRDFDILVIGAGIAGASIGAVLSETARVAVLERERMPGYHTTGRSVAVYSAIYGNRVVRAITKSSRAFFEQPPAGFAEGPLLSPRGALHIAEDENRHLLDAFAAEPDVEATVERCKTDEALSYCPILKRAAAAVAVYERDAADMDVHALHSGYLRLLRHHGGLLVTNAQIQSLIYANGSWHAECEDGLFAAPILINAAGAWADAVAQLANVRQIGIAPKRRTIVVVDAPAQTETLHWPLVIDIGETVYFKPDARRLLLSPADETPSDPCDAQPDELDIAVAIDRVQRATTLEVKQVRRKWAGLRSFAADRTPVVGFDADAPGFFWFAGQGGYGIQMAPALAQLGAALARQQSTPDDCGVTADEISPMREACRVAEFR